MFHEGELGQDVEEQIEGGNFVEGPQSDYFALWRLIDLWTFHLFSPFLSFADHVTNLNQILKHYRIICLCFRPHDLHCPLLGVAMAVVTNLRGPLGGVLRLLAHGRQWEGNMCIPPRLVTLQ